MLGSDPCASANWALSARLMPVVFPPQGYPQLPGDPGDPGDNDKPRSDQLRPLIADAMRQLPFEYRTVIYRAYYQGWTTERIANDLKTTEAAVKSRLHDGLRILRLTFHRMERRR